MNYSLWISDMLNKDNLDDIISYVSSRNIFFRNMEEEEIREFIYSKVTEFNRVVKSPAFVSSEGIVYTFFQEEDEEGVLEMKVYLSISPFFERDFGNNSRHDPELPF